MKLKRDQDNQRITLIDDTGVSNLELYFIPSFFIWAFRTNKTIVINSETDEIFYHNLAWLMNNSYEFPHKYSKKSNDELIWFSEQCYDIENEEACNMTSRLIIKRINEEFHISYSNPFYEKYNIDRDIFVTFSPAGNGFLSRNTKTGHNLQDEIIRVFYSTLYEQKITDGKYHKKVREI